MCSSGVGFDPVVDGTRYTFDVAGLYNGVFVMKDRQTGSVWTHFDGTVLTGPLAGEGVRLDYLPLIHTRWEDWRAEHPETKVLDWYPEFADRYRLVIPGRQGLGPNFQRSLLGVDERLPENTLVLGVELGESSRAYPLDELGGVPAVLADQLGGAPVVIFTDGNDFALAYSPVVDGETLRFTVEGGRFTAAGSEWDRTGRAVSGPLAGTRLDFVTSFVTEWYGWAAYHPDTTIYQS